MIYNKGKLREREAIKMFITEKKMVEIKVRLDNNEIKSLDEVYSIAWDFIKILDKNKMTEFMNLITEEVISKDDLINLTNLIDKLERCRELKTCLCL